MRHDLIGSYPPPLGGVSVFLYRKQQQLRQRGDRVVIVDYLRMSRPRRLMTLLGILFDPRPRAFDVNAVNVPVLAALAIRFLPSTVTFRDHGWRLLGDLRGFRKLVFRAFLRRAERVVLVNTAIRDFYVEHGYTLPRSTTVEHAFIPPPAEDEDRIRASYDAATLRFIEEHRPLIVVNAFQIAFHAGVDLYGLDLCIALVDVLRPDHPDVGLLIALAQPGDPTYLARLRDDIARRGIEKHVHFMTDQRELWPLLKQASLLVRPTNTDGDAVSIREALHFGCPVVASDVVERPDGTVLFSNRDLESFVDATKRILSKGCGDSH